MDAPRCPEAQARAALSGTTARWSVVDHQFGGRTPIRNERYRAPATSGEKLAVPPWPAMGDLLAANIAWRDQHNCQNCALLGKPLSELVAEARREVLTRAAAYTIGSLADAPAAQDLFRRWADAANGSMNNVGPFIVTGHQPGLVHPGVWVKNFAAASLAESHRGVGLHLIVDADLCRAPSIVVPAGSVDAPRMTPVEFDLASTELPWEERHIVDEDVWRTFPERVHETAGDFLADPMLDEWWPTATSRARATGLIGAALAQARHRAELEWGCRNLELPQSELCRTAAFRWFAAALLAELPRFVASYNGALADYRHTRKLRNHAQPVPDLAIDGDWFEAPFWVWTAGDARRRPLYGRVQAAGLLLSDRRGWEQLLPLTGPADATAAVAALGNWEAAGVKLRSRALITTMFTRLIVADLFLHGIGGAKYDEATDAIAARFFGAAPPAFAAISGTLRLPIPHPPSEGRTPEQMRSALRDLAYHPERVLAATAFANGERRAAETIIAQKRRWVETEKTAQNAAKKHAGIVAANAALQPFLADERAQLERQIDASLQRTRANRVLESREFAFCLFPSKSLTNFFLDF
jgi:hypothetical protein